MGPDPLTRPDHITLYDACSVGSPDHARDLLAQGGDPYDDAGTGTPCLHTAVMNGHLATARVLLDGGVDPNCHDLYGFTALHAAAHFGFDEAVSALLAAGADPDAMGKANAGEGLTPLCMAAESGQSRAVVAKLLDAGASPDAHPATVTPPLHNAFSVHTGGDVVIVRALLDAGADPTLRDTGGRTALHHAAQTGDFPAESLDALLHAGATIDAPRHAGAMGRPANVGATPLHEAAEGGEAAAVRLFLSRGAAIGATDHQGRTPLDLAKASFANTRKLKPVIALLGQAEARHSAAQATGYGQKGNGANDAPTL